VLISFVIMYAQGISSNIMSLGGIAIAIGAMVDAVIIMIENAHKHLERDGGRNPTGRLSATPQSRSGHAVLFAAGHYRFLHSSVHAAGSGRPPVQAAGVYEDLFHGRGRPAIDHARPYPDGLFIRGKMLPKKRTRSTGS